MSSKLTPELRELLTEYDRLRELRKQTAYIATRQERLEAVAKAAREGDELPDLREDTGARNFQIEGVDLALSQVADEVIAQVALDHDDDLKMPIIEVPHGATFTSDDLLALARERFAAAERAREHRDAERERIRRYDAALEKKHRGEFLTPEDYDDLNPPGSFGAPRQVAAAGGLR
jgi:hypothetical protein